MSKKFMEDMQSKGVRITNISREKKREKIVENHNYDREPSQKIPSRPEIKRKNKKSKKFFIIILIVCILLGIYFICNLLQHARITIYPKNQSFTLNHTPFNVSSNPNAKIHFELMIIDDTQGKNMNLTQTENVSQKAHGEVTIYNEYSTKPLTLAIHTFLADGDGKAYETDQAVTIPGFTKNTDLSIVSGKANIGITAFLSGDTYNGSPSDFTITAYKNTKKAKLIYGKLSSPLVGGAEGTEYVLGPDDKGTLDAYAGSTFKSNLLKKVNAEVPPGYILYPNAMTFSYQVDENTLSKTPNTKVNVTGTMASIILNQQDLSNSLINNLLPGISMKESKEIEIKNIDKLTFNFVDPNQIVTKDMTNVAFTLSGTLNALWHPDIDSLRTNIISISKENIATIFQSDPGITSAHTAIFPPWQSHMPRTNDKIHIDIQ